MAITTPEFRASYPNLFTAKKNDLNGKDEFSVVALFKKGENLENLKNAVKEAIIKKWGADPKKHPTNLRLPFRDQGDRAKVDEETGKKVLPPGYEEGAIYLNLKTTRTPGIVDAKREPVLDSSKVYAGQYMRASVNAFAYDQKGNRGVSLSLENIQLLRDGEPLGGRVRAEDAFEAVSTPEGGAPSNVTDLFS